MTARKYWRGCSLVPEIGPKRMSLLLQAFGSVQAAWEADDSQLRAAGLDPQPLSNLLRARQRLNLDAELAKVERAGAHLLVIDDDDYPPLLKPLPGAPFVLYARGTLTAQDHLALAIVGTRKASVYGRDAAAHFSKELARQGVTIVSGLAHGIDSVAHNTALEVGGRTIAVLGCGVDQVYPRDHADLARRIAECGALISEFPIGTRPEPRHFPRRNRIISGLSLGVLVIEAPESSGALITASTAAEQGRDVFAIPGNIFSPSSAGANRLIQDGAKLVMTLEDILGEINVTYRNVEISAKAERIAPADGSETALLQYLGAEPIHIDDLVRLSGLPTSMVTSTLTILELKGIVGTVGHMQYRALVEG